MNRKSLSIYLIIATVSILSLSTYAWLTFRTNDTAMVLTVGENNNVLVTLSPYQLNANISPRVTYTGEDYVMITANNNSTKTGIFNLYYNIEEISSELINSNFKYTIERSTTSTANNSFSSYTIGDFSTASNGSSLTILNEYIPGNNTTYYYRVYVWYDGNDDPQSTLQNETFNANLNAEILDGTFKSMMVKTVLDNSTVNFAKTSGQNGTNGVYLFEPTKNDLHPVYYYRGSVNNNVIFADMCWKIVRTTSTGGTKLVYSGLPSGGTCNNSGTTTMIGKSKFNPAYNDVKYVGYMYEDNGTMTSSTIKTYIDSWYSANLSSYTSILEDTVWCNDRTTASISDSTINYGAYGRHNATDGTHEPIVTCPRIEDAFTVSDTVNGNGLLTYPVGLLTMDEINMAGGRIGSTNNTFYPCSGEEYWLLSPVNWNGSAASILELYGTGNIFNSNVILGMGVRPSVSLKPEVTYSSGDGSADKPYRIE